MGLKAFKITYRRKFVVTFVGFHLPHWHPFVMLIGGKVCAGYVSIIRQYIAFPTLTKHIQNDP